MYANKLCTPHIKIPHSEERKNTEKTDIRSEIKDQFKDSCWFYH